MKNSRTIDDLLEVVDAKLVKEYEQYYSNELDGMTLAYMNREYQAMCKLVELDDKRFNRAAFILIAAGVWMIAVAYRVSPHYGLALYLLAVGPFLLYLFSMGKKLDEKKTRLSQYANALGTFRVAVGILNPLDKKGFVYSEASIRYELVFCATRILEAESKFDRIRLMPSRQVDYLLQVGSEIVCHRHELKQMLGIVPTLGLKFDYSELFASAQELINKK